MICETEQSTAASERVKNAIVDFRGLQSLLRSKDLDRRLLNDFRDALNRVRNVAWAAQQSLECDALGKDPAAFQKILAGERIRTAYQLCCSIREDLKNDEIEYQKGQLIELHAVASELVDELKDRV